MPRATNGIAARFGIAALACCVALLGASSHRTNGAETLPSHASTDASDRSDFRALLETLRYAEAEALARKIVEEAEAAHGPDSLEAAEAIDLLTEILYRRLKGGAPGTQEDADRAIRIKEATLGPEHPSLAASLLWKAQVLRQIGETDQAGRLLERALAIDQKTLGPNHQDTARAMTRLALIKIQKNELSEARPLLERALVIQEARPEPDPLEWGLILLNFGNVHHDLGDYATARGFYQRALEALETRAYPEPRLLVATLSMNGDACMHFGDFAGAKSFWERAIAVFEQNFGTDNPQKGGLMGTLAIALLAQGDYDGARTLMERGLALMEKGPDPDGYGVGIALINFCAFLTDTRDLSAAVTACDRAIGVFERPPRPVDPALAAALSNRADIYALQGDLTEARRLQERALSISEKAHGPEHPGVADILISLARLDMRARGYASARPLLDRALAISEKRPATNPFLLADVLTEIARLQRESGYPNAGKPLLERALGIREAALGGDHPVVARTLNDLAATFWAMGEIPASFDTALRAEGIGREHLRLVARAAPETQALRYASLRNAGMDLPLTILSDDSSPLPTAARRTFDAVTRSRAVVLDEMARRHRTTVGTVDAEVARLNGNLASARRHLANLVLRGTDSEDPARYPEMLNYARREKEDAERALAVHGGVFGAEREQNAIGFANVQGALPPGSALVSYVLFNHLEKSAARAGEASVPPQRTSSYMAFVLQAGAHEPLLAPLGPAGSIDALVDRWKAKAATEPSPLAAVRAADEAEYREAGRKLRAAVWDPIEKRLRGARQVFLVPDSALNLVSFEALPAKDGRYLLESGPIIQYLSAERDLVAAGSAGSVGHGLLVLGGADYDTSPGQPEAAAARHGASAASASMAGQRTTTSFFRSPPPSCDGFRSLRFDALPGAVAEADDVRSLWRPRTSGAGDPATELTGSQASEEAFKRLSAGHRVIHLATHGFFMDDRCLSNLEAASKAALDTSSNWPPSPSFIPGDNPLLLSGLALAGANRRNEVDPNSQFDDGILTAEEIASLDLSDVEWVVLSGCQTGLGKIQSGEGVLGLRRAFRIAGARTIIMSLWKVKDDAAREWMRKLYEGRLSGLSTAEAVRRASLRVIEDRRKAGLSDHPFYWGAFVAAGDWR